jgi:hypothetical protein
MAAKTDGLEKSGRQSQSIEPAREMRAAVRQSPTAAYSSIGGGEYLADAAALE